MFAFNIYMYIMNSCVTYDAFTRSYKMNLQNVINELQFATAELKADNDAAELKSKITFENTINPRDWQDGLNQEYADQLNLESMFGDY